MEIANGVSARRSWTMSQRDDELTKKSRAKRARSRTQPDEFRRHDDRARGSTPARGARRPASVIALLGVAVLGVGGYLGWRWLAAAPEVVIPSDADQLHPQFWSYVSPYIQRVREAPRDADQHATLGLVYEANELWPEAQACFRNAVELDPLQPLGRLHLAIATQKLGDSPGALAVLRETVQQFPGFAFAHHRLGDALLETGAIAEAESAFRQVIEHAPTAPEGYMGLADVKLRARDFVRAAELLETALELRPGDRSASYLLGLAYGGLGRRADAQRELNRGANSGKKYMIDPWMRELPPHAKGVPRQMRRALAFMKAGRHAQAAQFFEETLRWHPRNVDVMNNLAIVYMRLEQPEKARDMLLRAERTNYDRYATYVNLALCHIQLGQVRKALEYADRAVTLAPKVAQTHRIRARCLLRFQRNDDAVEALRIAARLEPKDSALHMQLGNLCAQLNRDAEAKEHYRDATIQAPSLLQAHLSLGDVCLRLGELDEASAALAAAQRLAPDDPQVTSLANRLSGFENRR